MSEIQRYNGIEADPEGAFVYYDDYHALATRLAAAEKELQHERMAHKLCADTTVELNKKLEDSGQERHRLVLDLTHEVGFRELAQAEATRLRDCLYYANEVLHNLDVIGDGSDILRLEATLKIEAALHLAQPKETPDTSKPSECGHYDCDSEDCYGK